MNPLSLSYAFLRHRWGQALLSILVGALAVAAVETVLVAERGLPAAARQAFGGVDMVIGPKGSAFDLVMCCVLHISEPRGLVPLDETMTRARQPLVRHAAPLALGDNYRGTRIVGSTGEIFDVYHARIARGEAWTKPMEAVVGAEAARQLNLAVGDRFAGSHGLSAGGEVHSEFPYTVTGILAPTGSTLDRLIVTDIQSVYIIHHHHEAEEAEEQGLPPPAETPPAASAVLVSFKSPVALTLLPREIDATTNLSAASPALEAARLARAARPAIAGALALGLMFAAIAAATAATALMAAMNARAKDLALMRALGARPAELAGIALIEATMLALATVTLGFVLATALGSGLAHTLALHDGLMLDTTPKLRDFILILAGATGAAALAAIAPALRAANAPIETVING